MRRRVMLAAVLGVASISAIAAGFPVADAAIASPPRIAEAAMAGIPLADATMATGVPTMGSSSAGAPIADAMPWWAWPLLLFVTCFLMGIVAVPAGIGGGTLFVPIVGGFFPFHLDFVRGAGLLVALASALSAGPMLMRSGLASLRLALPLALLASASSIGGALLGLALPASLVQVLLGSLILLIVALMLVSKKSEFPSVPDGDALAQALALNGVFLDNASRRVVEWTVHRTVPGLLLFLVIGTLAGMFGIGAGWANVPALNLLMGAPLRVSAGTSSLVLSLVDSTAAWVYINRGAVLPLIAVPSVVGMMLGARIGARLLNVLKASVIRRLVIGVLLFAGLRAMLKGAGIWT